MISTASEFSRLRTSDDLGEQHRASTEEAPLSVWLEVAEKHPGLRRWVVHNKTVPHVVLEMLAIDPDRAVRAAVAGKRKLRPELQAILAADTDSTVRARLAYNARCTTDLLKKLAEDEEQLVREAAARKLKEREDAL